MSGWLENKIPYISKTSLSNQLAAGNNFVIDGTICPSFMEDLSLILKFCCIDK